MPFEPIAKPEMIEPDKRSFRSRARRLPDFLGLLRRKPRTDLDSLSKRILLPSLPVTDEEMARATHQDRGQKLARQEMWEELAQQIEHADAARLRTPGGESATTLLAVGARADVVAAAEDALYDDAEPDPSGIAALEEVQAEFPDSYPCALVAALAHIDIAWAWRATASDRTHATHELRFLEHFKRAGEILSNFDGVQLDAPPLAAAQCALLAARPQPRMRVADDYERLIDLDPDGPRHMRALGEALLPARYGSYEMLELEARRTAARTGEIWGAGGYTWVYLDALALDPGAISQLDADYFVDGLRDIVKRRRDQHVINQLSAFCGIVMAPKAGRKRRGGAQENARKRIHDCLDWLLENHLQELHPLIWSQMLLNPGLTPALPSRRALVAKGRHTALRVIAQRFAEDIEDGSSIAFSSSGMYRLPAL
ncbi:hypothetical protein [uncultured Roseovarius sp.]|uniref:hypothetical protein n=1 Tax=uncultured Roseovarius sp. TaxID=293344 RepID=UPI00260295DD|nr:hypothetical protein [uncultured Roseovarius sp.]